VVTVTITEFRKNLFKLADKVLEGEQVEILHKGKTIRLVPKLQGSKLDRITPAQFCDPELTLEEYARIKRERLAEMGRLWEKKWSDLD